MVTKDIKYVGVNDHNIDLFEGQYIVPNGMAYNSYAIIDEKIAIMDSVDARFKDEWINNIKNILGDRKPDFLIVQHMEPDHSGSICDFMNEFKDAIIVSSKKAFPMMKSFFGNEYEGKRIIVDENDSICLGRHELMFISAPMVHWPEVIMTYDKADKALFSADGFGKFGALDIEEEWACEARRYYFGIVGKYGDQVQKVLKKALALDIKYICPLHGPVLNDNLGYYLNLYNTWSSYKPEDEGVFIAYTSIYGNTKKVALLIEEKLLNKGIKVTTTDLARCDLYEAVEDAFRYNKLILATTTYNGDIFPYMKTFIEYLTERNYQNRTIGFVENGTWFPAATKIMKQMLEKSKNITYLDNNVSIISSLNDNNIIAIDELVNEISSK